MQNIYGSNGCTRVLQKLGAQAVCPRCIGLGRVAGDVRRRHDNVASALQPDRSDTGSGVSREGSGGADAGRRHRCFGMSPERDMLRTGGGDAGAEYWRAGSGMRLRVSSWWCWGDDDVTRRPLLPVMVVRGCEDGGDEKHTRARVWCSG